MASERFHRAARDGILATLKEATRRDCNAKDEDGMTPTMWAAFEGHLDALRLLVARGGDPDKGDHFNNTSLHFAAERGHMSCVSFLVNFGANLWSLNFDMHTPKELAAINNRDEVLRYLDEAYAKEETTNRKDAKVKKEKAQKEVEKKMKDYEKVKKKAEKYAEEEQMRLHRERQKMGTDFVEGNGIQPHRPSTVLTALRNRTLGPSSKHINGAPRYSEIVGTMSAGSARKFGTSAVQKKLQKKFGTQDSMDEFKVVEDGRRSSTLTGLRRDSEVMYVGQYGGEGRRGRLAGVFEDNNQDEGQDVDENDEGDDVLLQEPASIFDRPGFGSFAFRKSISSTLSALPIPIEEPLAEIDGESIGSAGSLAKRQPRLSDSDDSDSLGDDEWSPLQLFLVANGLSEYTSRFMSEKIDLESLMLLTDNDLTSLGLPLGPRRKLTIAIENRRKALSAPGQVQDSRL